METILRLAVLSAIAGVPVVCGEKPTDTATPSASETAQPIAQRITSHD